MKALIIYVSEHHGNTEKVADRMAKVLGARLMEVSATDPSNLKKYDLIGFGSGIYNGGFHKDLLELVERLPRMRKKAFIFSTSGTGLWLFNMSKSRLNRMLEEKGFSITGEFSCRGWDTNGLLRLIGGLNKGRPDKDDLREAEEFAKKLK